MKTSGDVVQLVRTLPCHGRGRGFESRRPRHSFQKSRPHFSWPVTSQHPGDAAFDESTSRLFVGTRTPAEMIVMDSKSGREVVHLTTAEGMDGVYFDAGRKRVHVSGGRDLSVGFAYVYQQKDADHSETIAKIPTRVGAGTSLWSPELNR